MTKDTSNTLLFGIIALLDNYEEGLTVQEISDMTSYTKPAIRRVIAGLNEKDKLTKVKTRTIYRLK